MFLKKQEKLPHISAQIYQMLKKNFSGSLDAYSN